VFLVMGWKLFWLCDDEMGFVAGLQAVQLYFSPQRF
jgi:hypothetical protein